MTDASTRPDPPKVLSIAGSDPTGGAGIQLDLQVFARHDVHGMAVPTALNVQTTVGVHRVLPAFPNAVGEQLNALMADILPDVIKIGMLATDDILLRVMNVLDYYEVPRVVDPVLKASDGSYLLERRAVTNLVTRTCRDAVLVTPNLDEAEILTWSRDPETAARVLLDEGAGAVLIKGGHADGAPDDLLVSAQGSQWLRGVRKGNASVHGTGCALSSAIAARLARGEPLADAVAGAKEFVAEAIEHAFAAGRGQRLLRLPFAPTGLPSPATGQGSAT